MLVILLLNRMVLVALYLNSVQKKKVYPLSAAFFFTFINEEIAVIK